LVEYPARKEIRAALEPYLERSFLVAWSLFLGDLAVYFSAVFGAVAFGPVWARLLCAIIAGAAISPLFVIGHDAAHGAYTDNVRVNNVIGRVAFLPALHNYSMWQVQHNQLHHRLVNLKGFNSWSPLTKAEFDTLPIWRRLVERLYRSPLGFAPYYLVERWWKDKFLPHARARGKRRSVYWMDFGLLVAYLGSFLGTLAALGFTLPQSTVTSSILFGFVVPFLVWNALMGATIFMQHTHPRVPWFEDMAEWRMLPGQEDASVHVQFPRWYGLISHNIMDHPVHHVHPKIPLYQLPAAQSRLNQLLGDRAVIQRFSPAYLFSTIKRCKLYDYREHRWLDFEGRPTSECALAAPSHTAGNTSTEAPIAAAVA
jgi:omega-6 fatty acid desaturase (delta-12 desaturase)